MKGIRRKRELCKLCKHREICAYKKQMEELEAELIDKGKLLENRFFDIRADCDYYEQGEDG